MFTASGATVEPHTTETDRGIADENSSLRGSVLLTNPHGLHMRPAMVFASTAQRYSSSVTVCNGDRTANGKSLLDLIMLAAEFGTELVVEVRGSDAPSALPVLVEILNAPAVEELDVDSSAVAG